uniref:Uncharacterized protein n=1 Tax=Candidatus Kentrum sp. FW TaxID=2126338 RepID=A0A450TWQ4_9GAMM|nr:MAG: hypothetical protein BECKFW1821C_GA0114237_10497 [Candidatus Kentron sp. FW]
MVSILSMRFALPTDMSSIYWGIQGSPMAQEHRIPSRAPFTADRVEDGDRYALSLQRPRHLPRAPAKAIPDTNTTGAFLTDSDPNVEWAGGIDAGFLPKPNPAKPKPKRLSKRVWLGSGEASPQELCAILWGLASLDPSHLCSKFLVLLAEGFSGNGPSTPCAPDVSVALLSTTTKKAVGGSPAYRLWPWNTPVKGKTRPISRLKIKEFLVAGMCGWCVSPGHGGSRYIPGMHPCVWRDCDDKK